MEIFCVDENKRKSFQLHLKLCKPKKIASNFPMIYTHGESFLWSMMMTGLPGTTKTWLDKFLIKHADKAIKHKTLRE